MLVRVRMGLILFRSEHRRGKDEIAAASSIKEPVFESRRCGIAEIGIFTFI
jgi:hypothetical protein